VTEKSLQAVGISGSPSARSRSRALLERALARLTSAGLQARLIDLNTLPADGLLGRLPSREVEQALTDVAAADIVLASTPVYRATYSGLLKVFFDLLSQHALAGKVAVSIATGGAPGHQLVLEHGLRPLFASVDAVVVPTGVYAVDAEFTGGAANQSLIDRIDRAVAEAVALADVSGTRSRNTVPE
jgi:FMN reductase